MWARADHKTKHAAYMRKWRRSHPPTPEQRAKDACRSYAWVYLKRGKIERQPCASCGDPKAQMHHPDYSQPLLVVWLCHMHHHLLHAKQQRAAA
jgi:hypothetical protein